MHFIKIQSRKGQKDTQWILRLHNLEEVYNYLKSDKDAWHRAMYSNREANTINISHSGSRREEFLKAIEGLKSLPAGTVVWPTAIINEMTKSKGHGMLKYIQQGLTVRVNEYGGFCDYEGWMKMWDMEIIEEKHLDTFAFPNDKTPRNEEVLILENAGFANASIDKLMRGLFPNNSRGYILNLKEQDTCWLIESIKNAKVIAVNTLALDPTQVNDMIHLMLNIDKKTIVIQSTDFSRLLSNPLFFKLDEKHDVTLVPDTDKIKMIDAVRR